MKTIPICLAFVLGPLASLCQVIIGSRSDRYFDRPDVRKTHTIYSQRIIVSDGRNNVGKEQPILRFEYKNGLLDKKLEYTWDLYKSKAYIYQVSKYWYKDSNLVTLEINRLDKNLSELYHYTYDTQGLSNGSVGYRGKRQIWKEIVLRSNDTTFTITQDSGYLNTTIRRWAFVSKDGLEKFSFEKEESTENGFYHYARYNDHHQIILEVDSSSDDFSKTIYHYDSLGRLQEISYPGIDSGIVSFEKYEYLPFKTIISSCTSYKPEKFCDKVKTLFYDTAGQLVYETESSYRKPEVIVYPPGVQPSAGNNLEPDEIVERFYKDNRLFKINSRSGNMQIISRIRYD